MKTLEDLENDEWEKSDYDSYLFSTIQRLRKKPFEKFTVEDLRIIIGQNIGAKYLVPKAIDILETNPFEEGDYYPGDLLNSVVTLPEEFWEKHPQLLQRTVKIVEKAVFESFEVEADKIEEEILSGWKKFLKNWAV